MMEYFILY